MFLDDLPEKQLLQRKGLDSYIDVNIFSQLNESLEKTLRKQTKGGNEVGVLVERDQGR